MHGSRFSIALLGMAMLLGTSGCPANGADAGPGRDGGGGADGGGADAGTDAAPMNPNICILFDQNCVEADAPVCAPVFEPNPVVTVFDSFQCRPSLGNDPLGASCTHPLGILGEDTCAPTLFCGHWGGPMGMPQENTCHSLCNQLNPCTDPNTICRAIDIVNIIGACALACDPFNDMCPAGTKCGLNEGIVPGSYVWHCDFDGAGLLGDTCVETQDCAAGLGCLFVGGDLQCSLICDDAHPCGGTDGCGAISASIGEGFCRAIDWSCVGSVMYPAPMQPNADFTIQALDLTMAGGGPAPGALVKACAAADAACAAPLDMGTTAADGRITLSVPTGTAGFDGFFEVSAPGFLTTLAFDAAPIAIDGLFIQATLMDAATAAAAWGGVALDPTRGGVVAFISACFDAGARVTLTSDGSDAMTLTGYETLAGAPLTFDPAATETAISGLAGMLNHPPGVANLTYTIPGGTVVAARTVHVRANSLSVVWTEPTP